MLERLHSEDVFAYAHALWGNDIIAEMVGLIAVETIDKACARKLSFFNSKSIKNILGGLFYLLGYRVSSPRKQRFIANILGTTDVTVRIAYKEWMEEFPDLFMDVIAKFASENPPRCFELFCMMEQKHLTIQKRSF